MSHTIKRQISYSLVINNDCFFHPSETTKFLFEVPLSGADAETKNAEHIRRIGRLLSQISIQTCAHGSKSRTTGALVGRLGGGGERRKDPPPLTGERERERPRG